MVELVWLGILLIVPLLWIVVALFEVQGGAFAVSTAARSAGRAFALAPDDASGRRAAEAAARQALDDQGLDDVAVAVDVECTPYPSACHSGTSVITVRVASRVVLPLVPAFLGGPRPSVALDSTHTVPIGRYVEIAAGARRERRTRRAARRPRYGNAAHHRLRPAAGDDRRPRRRRLGGVPAPPGPRHPRRRGRAVRRRGRCGGHRGLHRRDRRRRRRLAQTRAQAQAGVQDYLTSVGAYRDYPGLRFVVSVAATGSWCGVSAPVDLPLTVPGGPDGALVSATGSAIVDPQ